VSEFQPPAEGSESAFLDANVLRGQLTTDIVLTLAESGVLDPFWSQGVIDEMRRNRPTGVTEARIDRRIAAMNSFFPVAMVSGHDGLIPKMPADPKDRHVLAAAVHSRCDVLVTDNLKDFSPPMAGPYAMRVEKLSQFLVRKLQERPDLVVPAMQYMVMRNQRDPRTMEVLIDKMASMPELREFARELTTRLPTEQNADREGSGIQKQASAAFDGLAAADRPVTRPSTNGRSTPCNIHQDHDRCKER
jgi:predicted nucleic acid-binding protein